MVSHEYWRNSMGGRAELGDIDTGDREATFDNASGWHAQLWFDLPLGPGATVGYTLPTR